MFLRDLTWVPEGLGDKRARREHWRRLVAQVGEAQGEARSLVVTKRRLDAYVNHGRWVADCPECRGGIAAHPDYDEGVCPDCGRVYAIAFPPAEEVAEVTEILRQRGPLRRRNWNPQTEAPNYLEAENRLLTGVLD